MTLPRVAALALVMSCTTFLVPAARAGCSLAPGMDAAVAPRLQPLAGVVRGLQDDDPGRPGQAVGLWHTLFLTSDGQKFDETFQTIHSDGTEMMVSNGVPPVLGNVCIGVWQEKGGTVKMRHVTWNWNPDNTFAGTFVMVASFKVRRDGQSYSGTWSAKNFDPDGSHIPALDAEGSVTARRVTLD